MITGPSDIPADWNRGKRNVLSPEEVARIRAAYARTPYGSRRTVCTALACSFEVSIRTIQRVVRPTYNRGVRSLLPGRCQGCAEAIWWGRIWTDRTPHWRNADGTEHRHD